MNRSTPKVELHCTQAVLQHADRCSEETKGTAEAPANRRLRASRCDDVPGGQMATVGQPAMLGQPAMVDQSFETVAEADRQELP